MTAFQKNVLTHLGVKVAIAAVARIAMAREIRKINLYANGVTDINAYRNRKGAK